MSQYSPYPQDYSNVPNYYNGPTASTRPGAVTGLAITDIVLGSLGLLCRVFGTISGVMMLASGGKNPFMPSAPVLNDRTFQLVSIGGSVIDLLFWLALLIGSVAALSLKPLARRGLVLWSGVMIVWQIVWFILELTVVVPATAEMFKKIQASQPRNVAMPQMNGMMQGIMIGEYAFLLIILCVLPVLILGMWTTPRIRSAFGEVETQNQIPPQQYPPNHPQ